MKVPTIVSVLHQNEVGIGKSIPNTQEISRDPRDFPRPKPEGNLEGRRKYSGSYGLGGLGGSGSPGRPDDPGGPEGPDGPCGPGGPDGFGIPDGPCSQF